MVSGGFVEQGHASRLCLALGAGRIRACVADCWSESFGCGGLTLASELGQSQLPDVLQKPASKGNSSTIATPRKQCQTQIFAILRECFTPLCGDNASAVRLRRARRNAAPAFA